MFLGKFEHSCDSKNRLRIPTKFKKDFSGQLVVCKGNDGCLFVLPKKAFETIFEKTANLPMFDSSLQRPLRLLFSSSCEIEEDGQGRFLLPTSLKDFAEIKKDVVFVGAYNRIELWAKEKWEAYVSLSSENFDETLKGLGDYGI